MFHLPRRTNLQLSHAATLTLILLAILLAPALIVVAIDRSAQSFGADLSGSGALLLRTLVFMATALAIEWLWFQGRVRKAPRNFFRTWVRRAGLFIIVISCGTVVVVDAGPWTARYLALLLAAASEEVVFRWLLPVWCARGSGRTPGSSLWCIIAAQASFAISHVGVASARPDRVLMLFIAGLLYYVIFRFGGLIVAILAHASLNVLLTESVSFGLRHYPIKFLVGAALATIVVGAGFRLARGDAGHPGGHRPS